MHTWSDITTTHDVPYTVEEIEDDFTLIETEESEGMIYY